MCRRIDRVVILGCMAIVFVLSARAVATPISDDTLTAYVTELGLEDLLVAHYERELRDLQGASRREVLERLAELFASRLESSQDPQERTRLMERGRSLLDEVGSDGSSALRLALARAAYRGAEQTAERHRLRLAEDEEVVQAVAVFRDVAEDLENILRGLRNEIEYESRKLANASGTRAIRRSERMEGLRQSERETLFLRAWSDAYAGWLDDDVHAAERGRDAFENLLGLEESGEGPESVSRDRRSAESFARCILGAALCESAAGRSDLAEAWLTLLGDERAHPRLRAELPGWRASVLLDHEAFADAGSLLEAAVAATNDPARATGWLRLAASRGLEAAERNRAAERLGQWAIRELIARREHEQVFALADRYGTKWMGDPGFGLDSIRGAIAYHEARERAGDSPPPVEGEAAVAYRAAAKQLESALASPDRADDRAASAECSRLLAWTYWSLGAWDNASLRFEEASQDLPAAVASESLWMAIVAAERIDDTESAGADASQSATRVAHLTDTFLERFPSDPRAPQLRVRTIARAADDAGPREIDAAIETLLATPRDSDAWASAWRTASLLLYRRMRSPNGDPAIDGRQYTDLVLPAIVNGQAVSPKDPLIADARRLLEVTLDPAVMRLDATGRTLDAIDAWRANGLSTESWDSERLARRTQWLILNDAYARANEVASSITAPPSDAWAMTADLAVVRGASDAADAASESDAGTEPRPAELWRIAMQAALRASARSAARGDGPESRRGFVIESTLAGIEVQTFLLTGDGVIGARVLERLRALQALRPDERATLQGIGRIAGRLGAADEAIDAWRRLSGGIDPADPDWFEARYSYMELVGEDNPARALEIMEQHVALDPGYGPPPWDTRLETLHERLRARVASSDEAEDAEDAEDAEPDSGESP